MRKSSLFPRNIKGQNHLTLAHCQVTDWGIALYTEYSKTIQCKERQVFVALPWHANRLLCPARHVLQAVVKSDCSANDELIFSYLDKGKKCRMTYSMFTTMLKNVLLPLGLGTSDYSGHSFRRGGATQALNSGVLPEVIKAQGDWKSLSYLDYLDSSDSQSRAKQLQSMYK
jgi:hypothetical protein